MRWIAVWRRNFLVWRKLLAAAVLTNLADPLIMLFGLGYGLGAVLGDMGGTSYFAYLAAGFVASSPVPACVWRSRSTMSGPRNRPPYPRDRNTGSRPRPRTICARAMAIGVLPVPPAVKLPTQSTGMLAV